MAVTQTQYTGNGSTVLYSFTFPYLATTDVKVKINGVTQATTEYTFANATTVQMNTAPANGATVLIFRDTSNDSKKATFYPGSAIKAEDLNDNIDQILYVAQEVDNNAMSTLGDDAMQGDLSLGNNKVTNLGNPTSGTDAVNKNTLFSAIDTAIESAVLVGTDLSKSASSGQVTINHNVSGANTTINNSGGNVVQDITISAQGHVTSAGSVNLDNRYYTETELNAGQLDNRYFTETELSGGQLNNLYYTETELDGGQLDNRYFTETELNNGALDTRYFTEAELNNGQLDTRYFRQDSSETITSGATWSGSDNFIATTAAIDARIVDLVDDVGGFVPIANETSFPATNPDVNNGTGTLVSIKTISSARTPSGGSVVITNGAGSGNDVTITGLGSTVLPAGYGVIVETTGTTHTYSFHRLSPDATSVTAVSAIPNEIATVAGISSHVQTVSGINNDVQVVGANSSNVTTVAGSIANVNTAASNLDQIQNFANVYRIVNSDPTTSLNAGDLIFNTTTNKFKVYTGSAWVDAVARQFSDNTQMLFGDGNDFSIQHDPTLYGGVYNVLESTNGNIFLVNKDTTNYHTFIRAGDIQLRDWVNNKAFIHCNSADLGVDLYFDGVKKAETTSTGLDVDGNITANNLIVANGISHEGQTNTNMAFDGTSIIFKSNDVQRFSITQWAAFVATGFKLAFTANYGENPSLRSAGTNSGDLYIESGSDSMAQFKRDGAVELYYDGVKRFETTSTGISVAGDGQFYGASGKNLIWDASESALRANDNTNISIGDSQDLKIFHDGSNSFIQQAGTGDLVIYGTGEDLAKFKDDGSVELYYDGSKKFETTSTGAYIADTLNIGNNSWSYPKALNVQGSSGSILLLRNWDTTTYAADTSTAIEFNVNTGNTANTNASCEIRAFKENGTNGDSARGLSFYTGTNGGSPTKNVVITSDGHLDLPNDSKALRVGASQDLQIYHDGNDSLISAANTPRDLVIRADRFKVRNGGQNEKLLDAFAQGAVELYYDNSKKFETTSIGVKVPGGFLEVDGEAQFNNRLPYGGEPTTGNSNNWHKVGYFTGLSQSGSIHIKMLGTQSYGPTETISGETHIIMRVDNQSPAILRGHFYSIGHSNTLNHILNVAWKYDSTNSRYDVWVYPSADYTNISTFVDCTGGKWHADAIDTGSTSTPSGATTLDSGQGYMIKHGSERMFRASKNASAELFFDNVTKLETTSSGVNVYGTVNETSDIALKSNIQPLTNTLEKIQQITGYKYNLINSISPSMGVIAQDVEKVFPELVHGSEGQKTLQYSGLIGVLVEAVKDLSAEVAALKAK